MQSTNGMKPRNLKPHRRIVGESLLLSLLLWVLTRHASSSPVYDRVRRVVENQVPVAQNVHHIRVSRDGRLALVSGDDVTLPALWRLDPGPQGVTLTPGHKYALAAAVASVGAAYFG